MNQLMVVLKMVVTITSTATNILGLEMIVYVGLTFYLLYLANSYENEWIKLTLKLFSTIIAVGTAYMPLVGVGLANQRGLYDNWSNMYMWGFMLFWFIWFVIFLWEMFRLFQDKNKDKLEETQ